MLNNDVKQYYGSAHQMAIEGFYKVIVTNTQDYTNINEVAKSIAIINAINQSSIFYNLRTTLKGMKKFLDEDFLSNGDVKQ